MKIILEKEYSFANAFFWDVILHHHSTAQDAGRLAQQLGVKNLLLYHTEDKTLETRKKSYTEEASREFSGMVYVPDDLEKILL